VLERPFGSSKSALNQGADVNTRDNYGWCALLWASSLGHEDIVSCVLKRELLEIKDQYRATSLMKAAGEISRSGEDSYQQRGRCQCKGWNGRTALMRRHEGYANVAGLLLDSGADCEAG
jgi:ankyrin repeat protein